MGETTSSHVVVAIATDDNYARPAAVTARSVVANLAPSRTLTCCVVDMGLGPANRRALESIFDSPRVDVIWDLTIAERVRDLPETRAKITRAAYARLFLPEVLPDRIDRVLYLDTDTMARRCVGDLFVADMQSFAALGVPDTEAPFVAARYAVPLWHDAGRSPAEPNFNSGVLLMDVAQWRRTGVSEELLAYLTDGRRYFLMDQEALNATLPGRIGSVDPRWNQQAELFWKECEVMAPYPSAQVQELKRDPWIVHFSNHPKPWDYGYEHPFLHEWFSNLDQTPFAGWRPPGPTRRMVAASHARRVLRRPAKLLGLIP